MRRIGSSQALSLAAVAAMLLACSAPPPPFDAAAEGAKLLKRDAEWADLAASGKDAEKVLSYWTEDAVVIEPGQPALVGKDAIRTMVTQSFKTPGFRIHWVSQSPTFSPDGKLAYMRGADEVSVPGPKGAPITMHYQGYSIWRRETDGQWRCAVDISSEGPPMTPGAK